MKPSIKVLLWVAVANLLLSYVVQFFSYRYERHVLPAVIEVAERAVSEGVSQIRIEGEYDAERVRAVEDNSHLGSPVHLSLNFVEGRVDASTLRIEDDVLVVKATPDLSLVYGLSPEGDTEDDQPQMVTE